MSLRSCKFTSRIFFMVVMLVCFAFTSISSAQLTKSYSQRNSSRIQLQSDEIKSIDIFLEQEIELNITTHDLPEIWFNESQGGEYKNAVVFNTKLVENQLTITDQISPEFHFPQDKLSAHKIIDSKAQITIPYGMNVKVHVRSSFLNISGDYNNLSVNQQSGDCAITDLTGDLKIISVYAHIHLTIKDYLTDVTSKEGLIKGIDNHEFYRYKARVETIYGNVTITD